MTVSCGFYILPAIEVVPQIFPNLNVVAHLIVLVGWGFYLLRLAIFIKEMKKNLKKNRKKQDSVCLLMEVFEKSLRCKSIASIDEKIILVNSQVIILTDIF